MRTSSIGFCALVLTLAFASACGDDSAPADSGVDSGVMGDASVDTGVSPDTGVDGGMAETLTILVVNALADDAPLEGVTVAAISSAGTVTGTTGADGRVVLDGVVIEGATIEASAPGTSAVTLMNVTASYVADWTVGDALLIRILPLAAPETVTLSGTISNGTAAGEFWGVFPDTGLGSFGVDPMYTLEVPPDQEQVATVLEVDLQPGTGGLRAGFTNEITAGRLVTLPASATDATVDIDLSVDALPMQTATGSFPIPAAPHAKHDSGTAIMDVFDRDHAGWVLGQSQQMGADVDNTRFDYTAFWIAPTEATRPFTRYVIQNGFNMVITGVDGYPGDGAQSVTFLDAIEVVSPAFGTPLRSGESMTTNGIDPANLASLSIRDESGATPRFVWQIVSLSGGVVSLPAAPAEADLSGTTFGGRLSVCEVENAGPDGFCRRQALTKVFDVEP